LHLPNEQRRRDNCLKGTVFVDDLENLIDDGRLTRVMQYSLTRGDETFYIHVHEILNGPRKGRFIAVPYLVRPGSPEFVGEGATLDEALKNFLKKVKSASFDTIFKLDRPPE
jgi:hypothetical protein